MVPTSQPSKQPTQMPSAQPSSNPSKSASVWIVDVNVFTDSREEFDVNNCFPRHWDVSQNYRDSPYYPCSLRAAWKFCLNRVPWSLGGISECSIEIASGHEITLHAPLILPVGYYPQAVTENGTSIHTWNDNVLIMITIRGNNVAFQLNNGARLISTQLEPMISTSAYMNYSFIPPSADSISSFNTTGISVVPTGLRLENMTITHKDINSSALVLIDYGGTLLLNFLRNVVVNGVIVTNSMSSSFGGVLFASFVDTIYLTAVTVIGSKSAYGGSVMITASGSTTISNCVFVGSAAKSGGAVLMDGITGDVSIFDTSFHTSSADLFGGGLALHNIQGNVLISRSLFSGSQARYGSAILLSRCQQRETITSTAFIDNVAGIAGSIYWLASTGMSAPIIDTSSRFLNNSCVGYGCPLATEAIQIASSSRYIDIVSYDPATYPGPVSVQLKDYYGALIASDGNQDMFVIASLAAATDANCLNRHAVLIGDNTANANGGTAVFREISGKCVPGGYINVTLTAEVGVASTRFPAYTIPLRLAALVPTVPRRTSRSRIVSDYLTMRFRKCSRGEIYGINDIGAAACIICTNAISLQDNSDNSVTACHPCPSLAQSCTGEQMILTPNTWRWDAQAITVYRCPLTNACQGGNSTGENLCTTGFSGVSCGICAPGYFRSEASNMCAPCGSNSIGTYILIGVGFVLIICLVIFFGPKHSELLRQLKVLMVSMNLAQDDATEGNEINGSENSTTTTDAWYHKARNIPQIEDDEGDDDKPSAFSARFKIVVSTAQIMINAPLSININLSSLMQKIREIFQIFNINIFSFVPLACYYPFTFLDAMFYSTLIPIVVVILIMAIYQYQVWVATRSIRLSSKHLGVKKHLFNRYFTLFLIFTYIILPQLTSTICQSLVCIDVDEGNESSLPPSERYRLAQDLSISCSTMYYQRMRLWAIVMVIVYPVGIPALYIYLMYRYRSELSNRQVLRRLARLQDSPNLTSRRLNHSYDQYKQLLPTTQEEALQPDKSSPNSIIAGFAFIYLSYKPQYFYWDIVDLSRRLVFGSYLTLVGTNGSSQQLVVGIGIAIGYLRAQLKYNPYAETSENILAEGGQWQVLITFLIIWFLNDGSLKDLGSSMGNVAHLLLVVLNFSLIGLVLIFGLMELYEDRLSWTAITKLLAPRTTQVGPDQQSSTLRPHQNRLCLKASVIVPAHFHKPIQRQFRASLMRWQHADIRVALSVVHGCIASRAACPASRYMFYVPYTPVRLRQSAMMKHHHHPPIWHDGSDFYIRLERIYLEYVDIITPRVDHVRKRVVMCRLTLDMIDANFRRRRKELEVRPLATRGDNFTSRLQTLTHRSSDESDESNEAISYYSMPQQPLWTSTKSASSTNKLPFGNGIGPVLEPFLDLYNDSSQLLALQQSSSMLEHSESSEEGNTDDDGLAYLVALSKVDQAVSSVVGSISKYSYSNVITGNGSINSAGDGDGDNDSNDSNYSESERFLDQSIDESITVATFANTYKQK